MKSSTWVLALTFAALIGLRPTAGQSADAPATGPALTQVDAFERQFAVSLYQFDACGDPLAGRMFRKALAERFAQCPFTPAARTRYQQRVRIQQAKARTILNDMIEKTGGLPVQLDGMTRTCREQQSGTDYKQFRARLEEYAQGRSPAQSIIPAACDAADLQQ